MLPAPEVGDNTHHPCISPFCESAIPPVGCPVIAPPLCAWCLSEQGIPAGEGSHGICRTHANRLLLQQRARHRLVPVQPPAISRIVEGSLA